MHVECTAMNEIVSGHLWGYVILKVSMEFHHSSNSLHVYVDSHHSLESLANHSICSSPSNHSKCTKNAIVYRLGMLISFRISSMPKKSTRYLPIALGPVSSGWYFPLFGFRSTCLLPFNQMRTKKYSQTWMNQSKHFSEHKQLILFRQQWPQCSTAVWRFSVFLSLVSRNVAWFVAAKWIRSTRQSAAALCQIAFVAGFCQNSFRMCKLKMNAGSKKEIDKFQHLVKNCYFFLKCPFVRHIFNVSLIFLFFRRNSMNSEVRPFHRQKANSLQPFERTRRPHSTVHIHLTVRVKWTREISGKK